MRLLFAAAALLVFAGPAAAQPKAVALTPEEVADGWLMLFDGETLFGWKIDGPAEVKDGTLVLGKGKKATATPTSRFGESFQLELEIAGSGAVAFSTTTHRFRSADTARTRVVYHQTPTAIRTSIAGPAGWVDEGPPPRPGFAAPLRIETDGTTPLVVRSLKLRPTGKASLFNGQDLAGWVVNDADPKRAASKFAVTKDGELSVTNGPGDLKTEKAFADFVFQAECKTNGKWLNGGVFFRCVPGGYQNGYEAQIQNAYLGDDRTKPIDFGTGAIYRRVPARKVVSGDHEWFTLTVLADGPHLATWVNGYQTVDWTDDRKANDNPRQGLRTAAGHLSIQGHDPTTDLLFRRLRIAELR